MAKEDIYHYCATDPVYHPEWHWITDNIALGSYPLDPALQEILDAGISAIISLRMDEPDYDLALFEEACVLEVEDGRPFPYDDLVQGLAFLHDVVESGRKVYVHCFAGVSRSSFFVACYLMLREQWSFEDAVRYVQSRRSQCSPDPGLYSRPLLERLSEDRSVVLGLNGAEGN